MEKLVTRAADTVPTLSTPARMQFLVRNEVDSHRVILKRNAYHVGMQVLVGQPSDPLPKIFRLV